MGPRGAVPVAGPCPKQAKALEGAAWHRAAAGACASPRGPFFLPSRADHGGEASGPGLPQREGRSLRGHEGWLRPLCSSAPGGSRPEPWCSSRDHTGPCKRGSRTLSQVPGNASRTFRLSSLVWVVAATEDSANAGPSSEQTPWGPAGPGAQSRGHGEAAREGTPSPQGALPAMPAPSPPPGRCRCIDPGPGPAVRPIPRRSPGPQHGASVSPPHTGRGGDTLAGGGKARGRGGDTPGFCIQSRAASKGVRRGGHGVGWHGGGHSSFCGCA